MNNIQALCMLIIDQVKHQTMARNHCVIYSDEQIFKFSDNVFENNTLVIQPIAKPPYISAK